MADRIIVVPESYAAQVMQLLGGAGSKPVPVRAVLPDAVAPTWGAVLAAGARSGANNPRVQRSQTIQWEADIAGTEAGGIIGLNPGANQFLIQALRTAGVTWSLDLTGAAGGVNPGGNIVITAGTGTPPGEVRINNTAGAIRIRSGNTGLGFFGNSQQAKPTVTGSRGGNAALASLMTALSNLGLVTDSTTP